MLDCAQAADTLVLLALSEYLVLDQPIKLPGSGCIWTASSEDQLNPFCYHYAILLSNCYIRSFVKVYSRLFFLLNELTFLKTTADFIHVSKMASDLSIWYHSIENCTQLPALHSEVQKPLLLIFSHRNSLIMNPCSSKTSWQCAIYLGCHGFRACSC